MKTKFNKQQIQQIAIQLSVYKKLYVTTEGMMFRTRDSVEAAIRVKNMIIDDASKFVGYIEMTADMVSIDRLRAYGRDTAEFDRLFEVAIVPRQKVLEETTVRKVAKTPAVDEQTVDNIAEALGASEDEPKKSNRKKK